MGRLLHNDDIYELSDDHLDDFRALISNAFEGTGGVWVNINTTNRPEDGTRAVWMSPAHRIVVEYDGRREYDVPTIGTPDD